MLRWPDCHFQEQIRRQVLFLQTPTVPCCCVGLLHTWVRYYKLSGGGRKEEALAIVTWEYLLMHWPLRKLSPAQTWLPVSLRSPKGHLSWLSRVVIWWHSSKCHRVKKKKVTGLQEVWESGVNNGFHSQQGFHKRRGGGVRTASWRRDLSRR